MERCKEYFIKKNAAFFIDRIREFTESSATVELAAVRLECKPAEIAKSLSFLNKKAMSKAEAKAHQKAMLELRKQQQEASENSDSISPSGSPTNSVTDGNVIVIVAAGDAKVNTKKYKEKFQGQPKMLKREEVEELTGFPPGGVCPFGLKPDVKVYLDVSLKRFDVVFPAVGTSNTGIPVTPAELETYASNVVEWVDLCEEWNPEETGSVHAPTILATQKTTNEATQAAEPEGTATVTPE